MFVILFISLLCNYEIESTMESHTAVFYDCDYEIIRKQKALENIIELITSQLQQKNNGPVSINYTEAGYTLLQALQKGGHITLTIENSHNKAYLNFLIDSPAFSRKKLRIFMEYLKNALQASKVE